MNSLGNVEMVYTYMSIINQQKGFERVGCRPTEHRPLYVPLLTNFYFTTNNPIAVFSASLYNYSCKN